MSNPESTDSIEQKKIEDSEIEGEGIKRERKFDNL